MSVFRKAMVYLGLVDDDEYYGDDGGYYEDEDAYEEIAASGSNAPNGELARDAHPAAVGRTEPGHGDPQPARTRRAGTGAPHRRVRQR